MPEAHHYHGGAHQVDVEDHAHIERELVVVQPEGVEPQSWQHDEVGEVEDNVEDDVDQLQAGKLDGALLVAQVGERDALEGVDGDTHKHHRHPVGVVRVFHESRYLGQQRKDGDDKQQRRYSHRYQHGGIDPHGVVLGLVDKPEEGGLHAVGEYHHQQRRVGIDVGHHAILATARGKGCRLDGYQEIIDETSGDAADTIDGGIFDQIP